jgi:hypothetical protein
MLCISIVFDKNESVAAIEQTVKHASVSAASKLEIHRGDAVRRVKQGVNTIA